MYWCFVGEGDFAYCKHLHSSAVESLKLLSCSEVSHAQLVHEAQQGYCRFVPHLYTHTCILVIHQFHFTCCMVPSLCFLLIGHCIIQVITEVFNLLARSMEVPYQVGGV